MEHETKEYEIRWIASGDLIIEHKEATMLRVNFYHSFHESKLTRLEKLEMLRQIIERALNNPDLTE